MVQVKESKERSYMRKLESRRIDQPCSLVQFIFPEVTQDSRTTSIPSKVHALVIFSIAMSNITTTTQLIKVFHLGLIVPEGFESRTVMVGSMPPGSMT